MPEAPVYRLLNRYSKLCRNVNLDEAGGTHDDEGLGLPERTRLSIKVRSNAN